VVRRALTDVDGETLTCDGGVGVFRVCVEKLKDIIV